VILRLIYLYRNLTRNPLRTLLTCAAVALPIMIYVLSMSVITGIEGFLEESARELRLAVVNRASIINPLPSGYRAKIEALDPTKQRLLTVCGMRWLGGKVENHAQPLSTLAVQADTFVATFPGMKLTEEEIEAWYKNRQAIIVGRSTADQFGWKVGDRITINASIPPYTPIEFYVISTAPNAKDPITNFCRYDYAQEAMRSSAGGEWLGEDWISFFFVKCASTEDLEHFRAEIDGLFARSPDETKTQDEKTFMSEFVNQQFNLPRNLSMLAAVTIFVAVMAATNTMSMNLRDRMNETAVLKSLGFSGPTIFSLIQCEGLLLCMSGGLVGAAGPYIAFTYTRLKTFPVPLIQFLEIHEIVCLQALLIALLIGVISSAWPAWAGLRLPVVSALRNLE
jgi:putative ABC transport system permease protein